MPEIHSVAVFCGSSSGTNPAFAAGARELGHGLAAAGMRLVYGGGRVGLMGAIADAVVEAGGVVLGVIPEFLARLEVAHTGIAALAITDSMHSRKQLMFAEADAFVSLPGGLGTLDETIEIITWRQLGLHDKPVLLCDIAGSAAPLLAAIEAAIGFGFAPPGARNLFEIADGVAALLQRLRGLPRAAAVPADRL
ncbi:MAG TPA: TIGR00730 family Rossman fold protein [Acetobacteraceae bacterium]|nr:TIGR00730 family Rossman fold protein [Acetobacteraceae bacterium]